MTKKSKALEFADDTYEISITGRHVQVTDAMKQYAIEKISKIERFSSRIIDVHVTMDIQKLEHRIDIVLQVNHIKIKTEARAENMYAAIDQAIDKISEKLRRYKNKLQDHQARAMKVVDMTVNVIRPSNDPVEQINHQIDDENFEGIYKALCPHVIVEQEKRPLKTLTFDEAIMKMELSHDHFLLFRAEEDPKKRLMIIYRRADENYGLIQPEV